MKTLLGILMLLVGSSAAIACLQADRDFDRIRKSSKYVVHGPLSVEAVERENLVEIKETGRTVPFGYINEEWEAMKRQYREGDKLFRVEFRDGTRYFDEHYVLVREGCVVEIVRTAIS